MRWSIVRVIWLRELRDQLRDRRTVFMVVILPLLIYPLGGLALAQFAPSFVSRNRSVGVIGADYLPPGAIREHDHAAALAIAHLTLEPAGTTSPAALATSAARADLERLSPTLILRQGDNASLRPATPEADALAVTFLSSPAASDDRPFLEGIDRSPLDRREVDVLLVFPPDFAGRLAEEGRPPVYLLTRDDDRSRQASRQVAGALKRWGERLKEARFVRHGLPADFDQPLEVREPDRPVAGSALGAENLHRVLVKVFPFVLALWSLAGALYPAVDLCAGEKERGTMETLLITPASREEIVWGKFLAIWVFSSATTLLNLTSMALTTWQFGSPIGYSMLGPTAFLWCVLLLLPQSAFFSALCLAIGAYARSSKEGQYYLMPLFLVTMPLSLLTMAPGVRLNAFYSMVPVTGVGLLLQKLLAPEGADRSVWGYLVPVMAPMLLYSWLALRWAIDQFNREEVLFREAERLEVRLWLRRLLRDKEARPSAGQALFCFAIMLLVRWLTLGRGEDLLITHFVTLVAFVAAPALIGAFTLTTQPVQSLALRAPPLWAWPVAVLLALLLLPPLLETLHQMVLRSPYLFDLLKENRPLNDWLAALKQQGEGSLGRRWLAMAVFAWLPAVCEELAFRGLILTGLQRRYRPRTAVLLTSFLFALLHMNVYQFVPMFLFGMVLAYLTTRCGSVLPSILFHALHNTLLLTPTLFPEIVPDLAISEATRWMVVGVTGVLAAILIGWLTTLQPHPAYVAFLQSDPTLKPYDQDLVAVAKAKEAGS